jgi:hypothetical protein
MMVYGRTIPSFRLTKGVKLGTRGMVDVLLVAYETVNGGNV